MWHTEALKLPFSFLFFLINLVVGLSFQKGNYGFVLHFRMQDGIFTAGFRYSCVTESCQTELASAFSTGAAGCAKENWQTSPEPISAF